MQITVDTAKDEKEDIQKAIEILTHFLNKQPKINVIIQPMQKNIQQKPQQLQQASVQSLQQSTQQQIRLQQPISVQQPVKPIEQQTPNIKLDERKPRDEIQRLDPDLNHKNNNKASRIISAQQKVTNNDPETEDFLNRMLKEIDKTNGDDNDDSENLEIKEKEVQRVPFGSTEVIKREQQKPQQEDPEFTFEDLEKY